MASYSVAYVSCIGNFLIRLPVAANIAFTSAGATGGTPGSPTPAGSASDSTISTRVVVTLNLFWNSSETF